MTNVTLSCCSIRAAAAAADQVLTSFFRNIPPLKNTSHQCPKNCFVFPKKNVLMILILEPTFQEKNSQVARSGKQYKFSALRFIFFGRNYRKVCR